MNFRNVFCGVLVGVCYSATAYADNQAGTQEGPLGYAQPGPAPYAQPQPYGAPAPIAPMATEPVSTVSQGILDDAGSGGLWLSPTALLAPAGTWTFEDNELFFVGGSYSFTDQFTMSMHTLIPLTDEFASPYIITGKFGLIDQGQLRLAMTGNVFGILGSGNDDFFSAGFGGVASYCLDVKCHSLINGYIGALALINSGSGSSASIPIVFSGGLAQKLSNRVKLIVEVDGGAVVGEYDAVGDGLLAWYGLRFGNDFIGVNVGFAKPIIDGNDSEVLPMGLPWVNFVYRALPGS